ncbi:hypothetical protein D3C74_418620 [compost metagenome]
MVQQVNVPACGNANFHDIQQSLFRKDIDPADAGAAIGRIIPRAHFFGKRDETFHLIMYRLADPTYPALHEAPPGFPAVLNPFSVSRRLILTVQRHRIMRVSMFEPAVVSRHPVGCRPRIDE